MPRGNKLAAEEAGYICARCAGQGLTCCRIGQAAPDNTPADRESVCFPVSVNEQRRIIEDLRAHSHGTHSVTAAQLFAHASNDEKFYAAMRALFPAGGELLKQLYPAGGQHLHMRLRPDGACACLSDTGCVLSVQARPWYCRIFPFWVIKSRLLIFKSETCLAVAHKSLPSIMRAFSTDKQELFGLYAHLRRDWGLERFNIENV
ncbi:MAG: hypothetical protein LBM00_01725 [Deltaproteobacteria bacterium]|nr:hypothetical protein [Deltaproteobacteria bacterium]